MHEQTVVADTSCLIALSKLQLTDVLRELYSTILITPEVALEFGEVLPDFIQIRKSADPQKQRILSVLLDSGEAASIALAF
jgi:predicted nucleic acid-binding protein